MLLPGRLHSLRACQDHSISCFNSRMPESIPNQVGRSDDIPKGLVVDIRLTALAELFFEVFGGTVDPVLSPMNRLSTFTA